MLGNVNAYPFLVLSTRVGTSSIPTGGTTRFVADLNHNSAGDRVNGHVLNNVEHATFTFTGGTVNPATAPIVGGIASTTLRAGSAPGSYLATATVENSTSSKTVTVTSPGTVRKPKVRIGDATTVEGNSGRHPIGFAVRLSHSYAKPVTVRYTTATGSATAPSDYVAKVGSLRILAGRTAGHISVMVKGDTTREANESFVVSITRARNARIADPNGTGVIRNDDR